MNGACLPDRQASQGTIICATISGIKNIFIIALIEDGLTLPVAVLMPF
jgi:hypothetical protein